MSRRNNGMVGDVFKLLVSLPWWGGPLVAIVFYLGFRFLFPAILNSINGNNITFTAASMLSSTSIQLSPLAAVFILLIWIAAELKKHTNRKRLDEQTGRDSIGRLSWQEFEELAGEAFRRMGYEVERTGDGGNDGGVDLSLWRNGKKTLVQCKHWKTQRVGVRPIRELFGVVVSEKANHGIVVTSGTYTAEAVAFAQSNDMKLIAGDELLDMIRNVQARQDHSAPEKHAVTKGRERATENVESPTPACPSCGAEMVRRTARRGANAGRQFWGCTRYPECRGTR